MKTGEDGCGPLPYEGDTSNLHESSESWRAGRLKVDSQETENFPKNFQLEGELAAVPATSREEPYLL